MVPQDCSRLYTVQIYTSDTIIQAGTDKKLHYHLTTHFKYTTGTKTTVSTEECYLAIGPTVVVDESCWTQPQLRTILATTVHHREVILPRMQQHGLLLLTKFCDTAHQTRYLLILIPRGEKNKPVRTSWGSTETLRSLLKMEQSECCQGQTIFQNLKSNHTTFIHTEATLSIPHFLLE